MPRRRVRVPSLRLCAGIVLGPAAGLVTLWLLTLLGRALYTREGSLGLLLLLGSGIAIGCAMALTRLGTGVGYSWGLLGGIAAMFFCALHMQYLSSNALHDRGREVYGVIEEETSASSDPDNVVTYSYAVSYPGHLRQRELSTVNRKLRTGDRYLITIDPQRKVHPALGPRPGRDVFHLVWEIVSGVFVVLLWTASVMMGFRPDELDGWSEA
ncbi:hypothetical protein ACIRP2_00880 [Streptomyces sp. NPDC101194]|uniref:hypothetical protein n=1 Tax=Streptomyces sp. NPDC101194 TaxID=3366127 RepID=UPI003802B954